MNKTPAECLRERGWLTLSQFVQYVKEEAPIKSLSYPAMLRQVDRGNLPVETVGGQRRISKEVIDHYVKHGFEIPYAPAGEEEEKEGAQMLPTSFGESEPVDEGTDESPSIVTEIKVRED